MEHHLKFGSKWISFTLVYEERKSLGIKVYPEGTVEVLAPVMARHEVITDKVRHKAPWILKQLDFFNSFKPTTPPRRFVNGETHLYLGRQYRLKIIPGAENKIKAYRGQLWIYAVNTKPEALRRQLNNWYKQKAIVVFNELLEESLSRFNRYKIKKPVVDIRFMTKRWGSCTPIGKIILNAELIKAPKGSIEYVIIHELCHLVYHNHTKAFQELQNRIFPEWRKWKDKLEYNLA